jgi:hypothetical protein
MNTVEVETSGEKNPNLLEEFAKTFHPLEKQNQLIEMRDLQTGARYCECHIKGILLRYF